MNQHEQPLRYKTSEEAELLPLPLQLARLREINEELCSTHNHMVQDGAKQDQKIRELEAEIFRLTETDELARKFGNEMMRNLRRNVAAERALDYLEGNNGKSRS